MITTRELTKNYGKHSAVSGLTWHVPEGSIYGLLGQNGAGKSTTLRMLLGMVQPTRGSAEVAGLDAMQDSVAIRRLAAYVPDQKSIHGELRVMQFLRFYGSFFSDWSLDRAVQQLAAWQVPLNRQMKRLSKGMNAKVLLAAVFARNPKLLLLDEPTEGLDPESAEEVLSRLAGWAADGERSIVVSSHRLDEVERICDHVAFLQSGRLAISGRLEDLQSACKAIDVQNHGGAEIPAAAISQWQDVHSAVSMGSTLRILTQQQPETVIERLRGLGLREVVVHDLNLREIYLAFCPRGKEALS